MTSQNLGVATVNNSLDPGQYFNNIQTSLGTISSNQNAAVLGFFETQTAGNKAAAAVLASAVIYTSLSQGTNPMLIIDQFKSLSSNQSSAYLSMFLNLNRIGTSLLGINNQPVTNKYVQRAILA